MGTSKIKLVVVNENTLGVIYPNTPNYYEVLRASILKGATFESNPLPKKLIFSTDVVRLANAKDFDEYNIYFGAFNNSNKYEFAS